MSQCIRLLLLLHLLTLSIVGQAQQAIRENQGVSVSYRAKPLAEVIRDLEQRYGWSFSYSRDFIPLDYPITAHFSNKPKAEALTLLFGDSPLAYAEIGQQVVLRRKPGYTSTQLSSRPVRAIQSSPVHPTPPTATAEKMAARTARSTAPLQTLPPRSVRTLDPTTNSILERELLIRPLALAIQEAARPLPPPERRMAQISLMPYLGTNSFRSAAITNEMSVNVVVGISGGVDGFELGGLVNIVRGDVVGVQIAGLSNRVRDELTGIQLAGALNRVGGTFTGLQISGLANTNLSDSHGIMLAGIVNQTYGDTAHVQLAGLTNYSHGHAELQVSLLANQAGGVVGEQAALLFNKAGYVRGYQLGLVNVADTVAGISIGLLTLVKKGYNRVEISLSDYLWANAALVFGTQKWYNKLLLGARWDEVAVDAQANKRTFMSWGIGYGLGSAHAFSPRSRLLTEISAQHVNELTRWSPRLNLLSQLRLGWDYQLSRGLSWFMGPTINLLWTRDAAAGRSVLVPRPQWTWERGELLLNGWVGFQAGFRF